MLSPQKERVQVRGKVYPRALLQYSYDRSHEYTVISRQTCTDRSLLCHDSTIYAVWIDDLYLSLQKNSSRCIKREQLPCVQLLQSQSPYPIYPLVQRKINLPGSKVFRYLRILVGVMGYKWTIIPLHVVLRIESDGIRVISEGSRLKAAPRIEDRRSPRLLEGKTLVNNVFRLQVLVI